MTNNSEYLIYVRLVLSHSYEYFIWNLKSNRSFDGVDECHLCPDLWSYSIKSSSQDYRQVAE